MAEKAKRVPIWADELGQFNPEAEDPAERYGPAMWGFGNEAWWMLHQLREMMTPAGIYKAYHDGARARYFAADEEED